MTDNIVSLRLCSDWQWLQMYINGKVASSLHYSQWQIMRNNQVLRYRLVERSHMPW